MPDRRADGDPRAMGHRNQTLGMWLSLLVVVAVPLGVSAHDALHEEAGPAPDFTLTSTGYEDGVMGEPVTFSLSDYRGKAVLLDFMAVTCTSCRVLTEDVLRPLHAEYGNSSDFAILSIDTWADPATGSATFGGETREDLIRLQREEEVPWRHALDTDGVYRKYSAVSLPKVVVVAPDGTIVLEKTGIPPLAEVRAAVEAGLAGDAPSTTVLRVGLLGLAVVAGVASFFSPCSVGLIPAYMGFLLNAGRRGDGRTPAAGAAHTLRAGLATAAGIVSVYGVLALLFWLLALAGYGATLRAALPWLSPVVAVLLILLGVLMLVGFPWDRLARRLGMGAVDGRRGFFTFGVGYGLAAFGCTGPILLPVLLYGFLDGAATGLAVFALYAVAVAGLVVSAAALVAEGGQGRLRHLLQNSVWVTRASAALLVGAGVYLLWFDAGAGILWS